MPQSLFQLLHLGQNGTLTVNVKNDFVKHWMVAVFLAPVNDLYGFDGVKLSTPILPFSHADLVRLQNSNGGEIGIDL
jgi:hypothetical protein